MRYFDSERVFLKKWVMIRLNVPFLSLGGLEFAKNPDSFGELVIFLKTPKLLFLFLSRLCWYFSVIFPIFPTNRVKGSFANTLGYVPKVPKTCKNGCFLGFSLTTLVKRFYALFLSSFSRPFLSASTRFSRGVVSLVDLISNSLPGANFA